MGIKRFDRPGGGNEKEGNRLGAANLNLIEAFEGNVIFSEFFAVSEIVEADAVSGAETGD